MSNLLGLEDERRNTADEPTADADQLSLEESMIKGARWFYWIAALSVINSLLFAFGAKLQFVTGLGFTQLIDGVAEISIEAGAPVALRAVAVAFDLVFVAGFALAGYY